MIIKQFTTFHADGKPIQKAQEIPLVKEASISGLIESDVVNIYPDFTYQTIDGFGCAMTETSAYLLSQMEPQHRKKILKTCFGKDGNHYRFVRMHMDSCDYSLNEYQAVADPVADPDLETFSLERDLQYIIPMMKEALEAAEIPLSVLLSPWSPPACWKTAPPAPKNDASVYGGTLPGQAVPSGEPSRCNGGSLKPEYYDSWAKYLTKYVQSYLAEGIPVTMMTIQNEACAATAWDSCVWTAEEEKNFLKNHLYPQWKKAGLVNEVGIYFWDHNKERVVERAMTMLDEDTNDMLEGIAFHWYTGDHFEALSMLKEKFPDKILMSSECCALHIPGKSTAMDTPDASARFVTPEWVEYMDAVNYAHDIIGNLNHGMSRWIDWNMIVDENGGPRHVSGGFAAPITAYKDGSYKCTLTLDYIRHFSGYIYPKAKRLGYTKYTDTFEVTVAQNPDNSIILVALNKSDSDTGFVLRLAGEVAPITLPAHTISTLVIA